MNERDFTETAEKGFQDLHESNLRTKLEKSGTIKKWLSFYKEWFSLELHIEDFRRLDDPMPGTTVIVRPKQITIQQCLDLLAKKVGKFENYLTNPDEKVIERRKWLLGDYIRYEKGNFTFRELLLLDLFALYQNKPITTKNPTNPFKHHSSCMEGGKDLYVWVSVDMPFKKDKGGKYTIPPKFNLKKLKYKLWSQS